MHGNAIDGLLILWKSDLSWNKMRILRNCSWMSTTVWLHQVDFDETENKARWKQQELCVQFWTNQHPTKLYGHLPPIS